MVQRNKTVAIWKQPFRVAESLWLACSVLQGTMCNGKYEKQKICCRKDLKKEGWKEGNFVCFQWFFS